MASTGPDGGEFADLRAAAAEVWEANAGWWDEQFGEGNDFQLSLIGPALERLLAIRPGERVLELACGNGAFARRLAALGARVLATDVSAAFIERARARTAEPSDRIAYRQLDATDPDQLAAIAEAPFDAAVCSMAIMDMATIDPLMRALPRLLAPSGRFAFALLHPCFNHSGVALYAEERTDPAGQLVLERGVKVSRYLRPRAELGTGIFGQPRVQYYFDRSLTMLFGSAFRAGLVCDGLEEPAFDAERPGSRPLSWSRLTDLPPILAARLRPARHP